MSKTPLVPIALAFMLAAGVAARAADPASNPAKEPAVKGASAKAAAGRDAKMPSQDEMMAAWMKLAAPGEHHAQLKALAGSWKTVVKSWEGPGEPKVSEGTCESTLMMDGRYLKEEYTGDFGGMPFQGIGITGYDNIKKKYVSSWVDNFGTGIMESEGTIDPAKKVITYHSKMPDPMNPMSGKMVPVKMTTRIVDDGSHIFTMYGNREGKEVRQMEITYTRK